MLIIDSTQLQFLNPQRQASITTMGDYDFTDSDTLSQIEDKLTKAKGALQLAKDEATAEKPTTNLQSLIQGKITALETRKRQLQ